MVTQITFSKRFSNLGETFNDLITPKLEEKIHSTGNYAIEISPVWSGAFVNSWSIVPIGSGGGRSRISSFGRDGAGLTHSQRSNPESEKATARAALAGDVKKVAESMMKTGGATLANRAPHAKVVDQKYLTITRVRDRFR